MAFAEAATYNGDAGGEDTPSLIASRNQDGTLNLVTFPTTSPVEHKPNVPVGTGPGEARV
jgi:hypothetical protein